MSELVCFSCHTLLYSSPRSRYIRCLCGTIIDCKAVQKPQSALATCGGCQTTLCFPVIADTVLCRCGALLRPNPSRKPRKRQISNNIKKSTIPPPRRMIKKSPSGRTTTLQLQQSAPPPPVVARVPPPKPSFQPPPPPSTREESSPAPQTNSAPKLVTRKEGWLTKQGHAKFYKDWKQRYFVYLIDENDQDWLIYFDNSPTLADAKQKGKIKLKNCIISEVGVNFDSGPYSNVFQIKIPQPKNKVKITYVAAATKNEMVDWIRILNQKRAHSIH